MTRSVAALLAILAAWNASGGTARATEVAPARPGEAEKSAKASTVFGLTLYRHLASKDPGNIAMSPLSVASALGLAYAGAQGETARQMAAALHLDSSDDRQSGMRALADRLMREGNQFEQQLSIANRLWVQQGLKLERSFVEAMRQSKSPLASADFKRNAEAARAQINRWVTQETRGKINDLVGPGVLDSDTRLVLTNAVYLLATWADPFNEERTRNEPFHLSANEQVTVRLMHQTGHYRYSEDEKVQVLELPYVASGLRMTIILPREKDGLAAVEKSLTPEQLQSWVGVLKRREVRASVPRFQMSADFELSDILKSLGMPLAFSNDADFSGITKDEPMQLSAVIHKAYVGVDEKGTEAAAATAVTIKATMAMPEQEPPVAFRADHPFVFMITDEIGAPLFLGRLSKPEAAPAAATTSTKKEVSKPESGAE